MKFEICLDKNGTLMVARERDYHTEIAEHGLVKDDKGNDHICFRVFCEGKDFDDCMRIAQQKFKELHEISWEEFEKEWKKMDGNFPPDLEVSFLEG